MNDFETKYITANSVAPKVREWMELSFEPDPDYPKAIITSIYFDTRDLFHLREKDESDHFKCKYRIRWYRDPVTNKSSDMAFHEVKLKIGEKRFKKRPMNPNELENIDLSSEKFYGIFRELNSFGGYFSGHLFPSIQITYFRTRYIDPLTGLRLCVDSDIHIEKANRNLIRKEYKPTFLRNCVLEVKGHSAVSPDRLKIIENFGFQKNSFSKYEGCFNELIRS